MKVCASKMENYVILDFMYYCTMYNLISEKLHRRFVDNIKTFALLCIPKYISIFPYVL